MPIDRRAKAKLRRRLQNGLVAVAVELTNQAKVRATRHVDTGERRNSITHTPLADGSVLWGMPRNAKNVALELGFTPHWVPVSYIGPWMRRHGVGMGRVQVYGIRTRRASSRLVVKSAGLYVGGPGSRLDTGPGGAGGTRMRGRKRVFGRWRTKGQVDPLLAPGKVGFSVLRWTIRHRLRAIGPAAFARGYSRG